MKQQITIIGNLGAKPELRKVQTPRGEQSVVDFPVATNRRYTANGQQVTETVWFNVTAWGKQAEACARYLDKGRQVSVEGELRADPATGRPRVWLGRDGVARANFEVSARIVNFLGGPNGQAPAVPDMPEVDPETGEIVDTPDAVIAEMMPAEDEPF